MTSPDPTICPRCEVPLADNVVIVTGPETGQLSTRCCTPSCGWRDDEPDEAEPDEEPTT